MRVPTSFSMAGTGSLTCEPATLFTLAAKGRSGERERSRRRAERSATEGPQEPRNPRTAWVRDRRLAAPGSGHSATATWDRASITLPTHSSSATGRVGCSPESSKMSLMLLFYHGERREINHRIPGGCPTDREMSAGGGYLYGNPRWRIFPAVS